jgi:Glycine-zipper domain
MSYRMRAWLITLSSFTLVGVVNSATAQELMIYPAQGQSSEQQERDRYECHLWAVQQTGFDPTKPQAGSTAPPPAAPAAPPERTVLKGAARGAAVGAVGGAIAGDAGQGAAIGAATGGTIGAIRRRDQRVAQSAQAAQQQQAASALAPQTSAYNRAMGACLQGRGYTVS